MGMLLRTQSGAILLANCCCGCSLRTGTILIALWYMVASLVQLATMVYRLKIGDYMGGPNDQTLQRMFNPDASSFLPHPYLDSVEIMSDPTYFLLHPCEALRTLKLTENDEELPFSCPACSRVREKTDTYSLLVTSIVLNAIEALACAVLLYDGIKETFRFSILWMVVKTVITCLSSLVMVQMSTAFLSDDEFFVPGIIGLLTCGFFMAISAYFILVVYSYYRSLRQKLVPKDQLVKNLPVNKPKPKGVIVNAAAANEATMEGGETHYAVLSEA